MTRTLKHVCLFLIFTLTASLCAQTGPKQVLEIPDKATNGNGAQSSEDGGDSVIAYLDSGLRRVAASTLVVNSFLDTPDVLPGDGLAEDSAGNISLRAAIMEANTGPDLDHIVLSTGSYTLSLEGVLENLAASGDLDITSDLIITGPGAHLTTLDAAGLDRFFHVQAGVHFQLEGVTITGGDTGTLGSTAELCGGALYNGGDSTLTGVAMVNNLAEAQGGAIFNIGTLSMNKNTLAGNTALMGGALANGGTGTATLINTTVSGNAASVKGGGLINDGVMTATSITVTANTSGEGGGISNTALGATSLENSLVAANSAGIDPDLNGDLTSNGGNLVGDLGDATGLSHGVNGDLVGDQFSPIDPQLSLLANYGGTTLTHRLQAGSPAIDGGLSNSVEDQRGSPRPQDGNNDGTTVSDIGSVELVNGFILVRPSGGESLWMHQIFPVSWLSSGVSGLVKLDVTYDGGTTWENLANNLAAEGSYDWIPDTQADEATIRVSSLNDPSISDTNDTPFSIPAPNLVIASPNGGENLLPGQVVTISWIQEHVTGDVDLSLSRDNGLSWESLVDNILDTRFDWTVSGAATTQAIIRISSNGIPGLQDQTDLPFSILDPVLQITSPNGGETLIPGSAHAITWNAQNFSGDMALKLSLDGGSTWQTINNQVSGSSYSWTVPNLPSGNAVVRIYSNSVAQLKDTTAPFTIATPNFAITSPNGGETLVHGQVVTLSWTQENVPGQVDLSLSRDNGSTWESLLDNYTGTSFSWTVAGADTEQAVLRLNSNSVAGLKDFSDAPFSIKTEILQITSPNGGENLIPGSTHTITWDVQNISGDFNLGLSLDGGGTWQTIATNITGSSFAWTVPNLPGNAILNISSNEVALADTTSAFTIATPGFSITSPNGGESLLPGAVVSITWNQVNVAGDVDLSLSRDNGATWESLVDSYTGTSFAWTVRGDATQQALLRLNSNGVTGLKDFSDALFSIEEPLLQITSPNGTENLVPGTTHTLTWNAQNFSGDMALKLSTDNGSTWQTINNNVTGTSYPWTVPDLFTMEGLIRIYSNEVAGLKDTSDTVFSIATAERANAVLDLTFPNAGDRLAMGQLYEITWIASGFYGEITLELSADNGISWEPIGTELACRNASIWSVPLIPTVDGLVRITSIQDPTLTATSNGPFILADPFQAKTTPPGEDSLDRDIDPFNSDAQSIGLVDKAPYVRINQFNGKVTANLDPIGVPGLKIAPNYKLPGRHTQGLKKTLENYGSLGVGWRMGYGLLLVEEGEKESKNWEQVQHIDGSGNVTPFTRDYLFQKFSNIDPFSNEDRYFPDEYYTPESGLAYYRTRVRDMHFIDENLRRLTRETLNDEPDADTRYYHLMEPNGRKIQYAPALVPNPSLIEPRVFVPVKITEPNGRSLTITYKNFGWGMPEYPEVPSHHIESITDHEGTRHLIYNYAEHDSVGNRVNPADPDEVRRYITSVDFDGAGVEFDGRLATFSYQGEGGEFCADSWHLQAVETTEGYRTEIGLDPDKLPLQSYPFLASITSPQGGTVFLDYEEIDIEVYVIARCRISTDPDPGGEGGGDCDPIIGARPNLLRVSVLKHNGGEYRYSYQQIKDDDSVAYYEDGTHASGEWDPLKVTVQLDGVTQEYNYSRVTYYAMEPVDLFSTSNISRVVGRPLVRTETYQDPRGGSATTKREEWRYKGVDSLGNTDRIGGTRKQGYTRLPLQIEDYRIKKDDQWTATEFTFQWAFDPSLENPLENSHFLAPVHSDRYVLDADPLTRNEKTIRRTFEHDTSRVNRVISSVADTPSGNVYSTGVTFTEPYTPTLQSTGRELYHPNGPSGAYDLLGKVEIDYVEGLPLPAYKRVYTSETESLHTAYAYYNGGANQGLLEYREPAGDLSFRTTYSNYEFGMAKTITPPVGPASTKILNPDGTTAEEISGGVTTVYEYDGERRVITALTGVGSGTGFSASADPIHTEFDAADVSGRGNLYTISYQAANKTTASRYQWSKEIYDEWGRTEETRVAITMHEDITDPEGLDCTNGETFDATGTIISCAKTTYAPLGMVDLSTDAKGTESYSVVDVFGRTRIVEVKAFGTTTVSYVITDYLADADGSTTVIDTISETNGGSTVTKETELDILGRITKAGIPPNYTEFDHTSDTLDNQKVWKTTIKPYGTEQRAIWKNLLGQTLQEYHPEEDTIPGKSVTSVFTYDDRGLLVDQQMAASHYATVYDEAGRQVRWGVAQPGSPGTILTDLQSFDYHPINGQLDYAANFSGVVSETLFDTNQRPSQLKTTIPSAKGGPEGNSLTPQGFRTVELPLGDMDLNWAIDPEAAVYQVEFLANDAAIWGRYDLVEPTVTLPLSSDPNLSIVTVGETYTWRVRGLTSEGEPSLWTNASLSLSELPLNGPALSVVPGDLLSFNGRLIGTTATMTLSVTNYGEEDLVGTAQVVNDDEQTAFALEDSGDILIPAGGSTVLEMGITFSPDAAQSYSGKVEFETNGGQLDVLLAGEGLETLPAILASSRSHIEFGELATGKDYFSTFQISNQGGEDLTGTIAVVNTTSSGFSLDTSDTLSLTPGSTLDVRVKFHPSTEGSFVGYVRISTNDPSGDLEIGLTGLGLNSGPKMYIAPYYHNHDFGTVVEGESVSLVNVGVRINNDGDTPLELAEDHFTFTAGSVFRLDPYSGDQLPLEIPPGDHRWIQFRFDAPIGGDSSYSDTLIIDPGPGNGGPTEINLTAETEPHLSILSLADDPENTPIYDYMWDHFYYNVPAVSEKVFRITNTTDVQVAIHMRPKWPFLTCLEPGCGNQNVGRVLDPGDSGTFSIFADPAEDDGEDEYMEYMNITVVRTSDQVLLQERNVPLVLIPEVPEFEDFVSVLDRSRSFSKGYLGRDSIKEITLVWNAEDVNLANEIRLIGQEEMGGGFPTILTYDPSSLKYRNVNLHFPINNLGVLAGSVRYEAYLNGSLLASKTIEYIAQGHLHFEILKVPDGNFSDGQTKYFRIVNRNTVRELDLQVVLPPHFLARVKIDDHPTEFSRNVLPIHFLPNNGINTQKVIEVKFDASYGGTFSGLVEFRPVQGSKILPGTVELPVIAVSNKPLGSELKFKVPENVFRDDPILVVGEVLQDTAFSETIEYQNFGATALSGTFETSTGSLGMISVSPSSFTINPGETKSLTIFFSPPENAITGTIYSPSYSVSAVVNSAPMATLHLEGDIIEQPNLVRFMDATLGELRNEFVIDMRSMVPGETRAVDLTYRNNDPAGFPWTLLKAEHSTFGTGHSTQASLLHTGFGYGTLRINISLPQDYDTTQPNVGHFELVSFGGDSSYPGRILFPYTLPISRASVATSTTTTQTSATSITEVVMISYALDSGRVSSLTSPAGNKQIYAYSAEGGLLNISHDKQDSPSTLTRFFETTEYDPSGAVTKQKYIAAFGNDAADGQYSYDALGRLTSLELSSGAIHHYKAHNIDYDEWGYVTGYDRDDVFMDKFGFAYEYSDQGQLDSFTLTDRLSNETHAITYEYDAGLTNFGNLTRHDGLSVDLDRNPNTTDDLLILPELASGTVTYENNRIDTPGWEYDGNGRLTADYRHNYEYDEAGRLVLVTKKTTGTDRGPVVGHYLYDAAGNRVRTISDEKLSYAFRNAGVISESTQDQKTGETSIVEHMLFDGREVLMVTHTSSTDEYEYQFADRMGNPAVRWIGSDFKYQEYSPYGQQMSRENKHTGAYGFTGHEDDDSGLTYMNARFFTSELGRFTKPDPARDFNPFKPFSYNLYLYGSNNPINFTDPTGLGDENSAVPTTNIGNDYEPTVDHPRDCEGDDACLDWFYENQRTEYDAWLQNAVFDTNSTDEDTTSNKPEDTTWEKIKQSFWDFWTGDSDESRAERKEQAAKTPGEVADGDLRNATREALLRTRDQSIGVVRDSAKVAYRTRAVITNPSGDAAKKLSKALKEVDKGPPNIYKH